MRAREEKREREREAERKNEIEKERCNFVFWVCLLLQIKRRLNVTPVDDFRRQSRSLQQSQVCRYTIICYCERVDRVQHKPGLVDVRVLEKRLEKTKNH